MQHTRRYAQANKSYKINPIATFLPMVGKCFISCAINRLKTLLCIAEGAHSGSILKGYICNYIQVYHTITVNVRNQTFYKWKCYIE